MQAPAQYFKQQNNTYKLDAILTKDKFTITFYDLTCFEIYMKQYCEDDIGKQINRKIQLRDLFISLCLSNKNDEVRMQELSEDNMTPKGYELGDIVSFGKTPCYKVQKGGIITIYVVWYDGRRNQQMTLQSRLFLKKIKKLNEEQVSQQMSAMRKRQNDRNVTYDITFLKKENEKLRENVIELKEEVKEIRDILEKVGIYKNKCQMTDQGLKIIPAKQRSMYLLTALAQPNLTKFKIFSSLIQYVGQQNHWTQIIFNEYIPFNLAFNFKIKIVRASANINIMLGVTDYQKQKDTRASYNTANTILYHAGGEKGYKYIVGTGTEEGKGFRQNQIVQMVVQLKNKTIKWVVNGETRASVTHNFLADRSKVLLPYIEMYGTGDIIQLID